MYRPLILALALFASTTHAQLDAAPSPHREAGIQRLAIFDAQRLAIGTLRPPGVVSVGSLQIETKSTQSVMIGETDNERWFNGYWTYIELRDPMPRGTTIMLDAGTGATRDLRFNEDQTVSVAIKVNQLGYLPGAPKFAYLGTEFPGIGALRWDKPTFKLINAATRKSVFSGEAILRADVRINRKGEALSGEAVYAIDFTHIDTPGRYYLRIPNVGRSYEFRIGDDAWAPLYFHGARFLYHQRNAQALEMPFTAFTRVSNGTRPVYRGQAPPKVMGFPTIIGVTGFDLNAWSIEHRTEPPLIAEWTYGWRNAADEDDPAVVHLSNVFDILWNFERQAEKFLDDQLNLPESGNNLPDILDEALYFLEGYRALQIAIGTGEVPGWINNHRHRFFPEADIPWVCSAPDRAATLAFAAAFAKMAAALQRLDPSLANQYSDAAVAAFAWGDDPANNAKPHTMRAISNRGRGDEFSFAYTQAMADAQNRNLPHYEIMAKTALHALTNDDRYLDGLEALIAEARRPGVHPFVMKEHSVHLYWELVQLPQFAHLQRALYLAEGDRLIAYSAAADYRFSKHLDNRALQFGNSKTMGQARFLIFCYELTGDEKYLRAAIPNVDFVLGANPLGMSWVTYVGHAWPQRVQVGDTPAFPGISVYGPWESFGKDFTGKRMAERGVPLDRPLYKRWAAHPRALTSGNEYELNDSSALFCGLYFLPPNWRPCPDLTTLAPVGPWKNPGEFPLL